MGGQSKPQGFSGVVSYDGILYLGSTDGKVIAVNPSARDQNLDFPSSSDGEWSFAITMPSKGMSCSSSSVSVSIYGMPVVVNGLVCVGTYNGKALMMSSCVSCSMARSAASGTVGGTRVIWLQPRVLVDVKRCSSQWAKGFVKGRNNTMPSKLNNE